MILFLTSLALAAPPSLQLVESVPIETTLDDPAIPNTPQVWLELLRSAEKTLDIEQFYIAVEGDPLMESIIAEVEAAAARGVQVRIVADSKFAGIYPLTLARLDSRTNIRVRQLDLKDKTGGVQHAKFFIVDGEQLFLGSQNWDWRALSHVQELGVVARVPELVRAAQDVFEMDWRMAERNKGKARPPKGVAPYTDTTLPYGDGQVTVRPVVSPEPLLPVAASWDLPQLLALLDGAQSSVQLQLLSYAVRGYDGQDWFALDKALRDAGARGVEVQLLFADWSKAKKSVGAVQGLAAAPGVQVRFVSIPEASVGFIPFARVVHSKFLVVDGQQAWLGTSNGSRDYFYGSRNLGVVVDGQPFAADLQRRFLLTWDSTYASDVDPKATYEAPKKR